MPFSVPRWGTCPPPPPVTARPCLAFEFSGGFLPCPCFPFPSKTWKKYKVLPRCDSDPGALPPLRARDASLPLGKEARPLLPRKRLLAHSTRLVTARSREEVSTWGLHHTWAHLWCTFPESLVVLLPLLRGATPGVRAENGSWHILLTCALQGARAMHHLRLSTRRGPTPGARSLRVWRSCDRSFTGSPLPYLFSP